MIHSILSFLKTVWYFRINGVPVMAVVIEVIAIELLMYSIWKLSGW